MIDSSSAEQPWYMRQWYVAALLVLLPLWALGLFTRVAWTPDEPRELSLCAAMQQQTSKAVPELAGVPFCEKPPLTYWLGAASLALFGRSAEAARAPNLLYALIGTLAVGALARAIIRRSPADDGPANLAALVAALAFGTMELSWQVQIWLATDAPLLAGTAVALLGAWRAMAADSTRPRVGWWLVFHLGLIIGFMAKSVAGWLVPWSAVAGYLLWQGRWRELLRWEMHVGWVLHGVLLGPWVAAVAGYDDGRHLLKIFFWDNLVGRFLPVASEGHYLEAHKNSPASYLTGLPAFLAPWTFLALAALVAVGVAAQRREAAARFLAAAILPVFLLLSVSHTGRGIYLVIIFPAVAAALGWWCVRQGATTLLSRWDRWAIQLTLLLGVTLTIVLALFSALAPWLFEMSHRWEWGSLIAVVLGLIGGALVMAVGRWDEQEWGGALIWTGGALWLVLVVAMTIGSSQLNPWQDETIIAQHVSRLATQTPVVLFQPDETIVAQLDWHLPLRLPAVDGPDEARRYLREHPAAQFLARLSSDRMPPAMHDKLARLAGALGIKLRELPPSVDGPKAEALTAAGFECVDRFGVPAGRRYGLFALRAPVAPAVR
jgi:4-amino-4-deoxy-L-arabinose transferase